MCIPAGAVVIGASVFVLILNIGHPAELRAFIFYAEVRMCLHVHVFLPASAFVLFSECFKFPDII